MKSNISVRQTTSEDLGAILHIYNQGIEDRIATLETETKNLAFMENWFELHQERFTVLVAEIAGSVVGWASLNRYSARVAYDGVADLSVYVDRLFRGKGVGSALLTSLEQIAQQNKFHKILLFTFPFNAEGQGLYRKRGYREVGVFQNQGILDGKYVDVMIMEKLL